MNHNKLIMKYKNQDMFGTTDHSKSSVTTRQVVDKKNLGYI